MMMCSKRVVVVASLVVYGAAVVQSQHQCKNTVAKADAWFDGILAGNPSVMLSTKLPPLPPPPHTTVSPKWHMINPFPSTDANRNAPATY